VAKPRNKSTKTKGAARVVDERRLSYLTTFMFYKAMRERLSAFVAGSEDPGPPESYEVLEAVVGALFAGKPWPKAEAEHLIAPIADTLQELFILRDRRAVS
jgi:hypothetical protein